MPSSIPNAKPDPKPAAAPSSLADSIKSMASMMEGGPTSAPPMVAKGAEAAIHRMVGRMNDKDNTDGSKSVPTVTSGPQ